MNAARPSALRRNLLLLGLLLAAAGTANGLRAMAPQPRMQPVELSLIVPAHFAGWQQETETVISPIQADTTPALSGTYAQTLERVYRDTEGVRIMLSIAYGSQQRGDRLQAHRPEYCYRAQGFSIAAVSDETLQARGSTLPIRRLHAQRPGRSEPVSYWLTVGDQAALPGLSRKVAQIKQLFSGEIPDGALVRVSSIDPQPHEAYRQHDRFIADLLSSLPASGREKLAGRSAITSTVYRDQI